MVPNDIASVCRLVPSVGIVVVAGWGVGMVTGVGGCCVGDSIITTRPTCPLRLDVPLVRPNPLHRCVLTSGSVAVHLLLVNQFHLLVALGSDLIHCDILCVLRAWVFGILIMRFQVLGSIFLLGFRTLPGLLLLLGWGHRHGRKVDGLAFVGSAA